MPESDLSSRDKFRARLEALVTQFSQHREEYIRASYNESQVRVDFVDPLFEALGWDVRNASGLGPREREVLVESGGATRGRPDYSFRAQGQTRFFVEAKAPHVALDRSDVIMQAKGYAWNTKDVRLVVITDFEEFRLYDASLKPDPKRPNAGLIFAYRYDQYLTQSALDHLWTLSREAVHADSLEQLFSKEGRGKRQRIAVDESFLADLSGWREQLAKAMYRLQPGMAADSLNSAVQALLDRLIFIRVAEDRGALPPNQLQQIVHEWKLSGRRKPLSKSLRALFREVNDRLNGEIFRPDFADKDVLWDESLTAKIVEELYPPALYRFDVIGVELLGSIYERYLGKTIRVTEKRAIVEEKPEARKAGGVYYTPKHIVDYIVANTVGKLVEGKTPEEIAKLKIIDPACGSGSFLLGAYQYLLDYHLKYYVGKFKGNYDWQLRTVVVDNTTGEARLALEKKAEILVNNIFGVDLDQQAVEITMMSLYIKMLEGETQLISGQAVLPRLADNIKRGNSLISGEMFDQQLFFDVDEMVRIAPFHWSSERVGFGKILKTGGFDCVIGNPPYLFITEIDEAQKKFLFQNYATSEYRFDVYGLFTELAITKLARRGGYISFIVPHTLLSNDSFAKLRRLILAETSVERVIDIGPGVFAGAKNETMIFILRNGPPETADAPTQVILTSAGTFPEASKSFSVAQTEWVDNPGAAWLVNVSGDELRVIARLEKARFRLGDLCAINQGLRTGDNEAYLSDSPKSGKWKPAAGGKHVGRYEPLAGGLYVYYDPAVLDAPRRKEIFESAEKLVVQEIRNITLPRRIIATYDDRQFYCLQSTNVVNLREAGGWNIKYLLGILNSNAANFFFRQRFSGNNHIASNQLARIPVPEANPVQRDELVALVTRLLELHRKLAETAKAGPQLEHQIKATDEQIDALVYQLYGLTDDEIKVVESS